MPKVKTHKGTAKENKKNQDRQTNGRSTGQDHFNSRETGKTTKNKSRDLQLGCVHQKLKSVIPYK